MLRDAATASRTLILIGTAPRSARASAPPTLLEADGIATRVVSHAVPRALRASRTRPTATACCRRPCARASRSRPAATFGWDRWVGDDGDFVGMKTFGASGAAEGPVRALRLHRRATSPREAARSWSRLGAASMSDERERQRAARGADGGGHERLARPDPAQADRRAASWSGSSSEDSLRGVTSNPAIFEKAILGSTDYDEQIAELAGEGLDAREIYEEIAITDVQLACDVLRPVWDEADGADGFVSLEVGPTSRTTPRARSTQARDYWKRVDRPNLMIKIPGHRRGRAGDRGGDLRGHQHQRHAAVLCRVLRRRSRRRTSAGWSGASEAGESLDVHSVASFFVSRVDTEVDKRLEELRARRTCAGTAGDRQRARRLPAASRRSSSGERFAAAARGRRARSSARCGPRPASRTRTTRDTKYVDGLVAPAHRQHDADADAARLRRAARGRRRDRGPGPERRARRAGATPAST